MKRNLTAAQREADILAKLKDKGGSRAAEVIAVDMDARTVELAFSSEAEVPRWFGIEILSHDEGACDLSRLNDGGAVLDGHDWGKHIGVVEKAWIDPTDRRGRALVRYSRNAEGEAMLQDIHDKIKRHVSVGYRILAIKLTEEREDVDVYTVTRWQPYEISNVPIPADTTVGIGRAANIPAMDDVAPEVETSPDTPTNPTRAEPSNKEPSTSMKTKTLRNASGDLVRAEVDDDGNIVREIEVIERADDGVRNARNTGAAAERGRVNTINDLADQFGKTVDNVGELVREAIKGNHTPEQFQRSLLEAIDKRAAKPLNDQLAGNDIGLTDGEIRRYSVLKVVRALIDPTDVRAQREAAFEFSASEAARAKQSNTSDRFVIPTDVLRHAVSGESLVRAPLASGKVSGANTGGNLIATELQPGSFIDILRNAATIMRRGRVLGGLTGNIDIPKKIAGTQGYWLGAEDEESQETGIELGQVSMTPKTVAAFTEFTRKMVQQSSMDVEALLRADLAEAMALTIDKAGYYGTGAAGQPLGIANLSGINAVPFAGDYPTFAELVQMETSVASDNALVESFAYAGNAKLRGHAKTTLKFAGVEGTLWEQGGTLNGYSSEITNQVNDGDVFFNNFADLLIGLWGGLELHVDPFTHSRRGRIRITTFQDVDFAHRRAESFSLGRKTP